MATGPSAPGLGVGQALHAAGLALLLAASGLAWTRLGEPLPLLFWVAIAVPVAHQVFVWLAWRLELRSGATLRAVGFPGYLAVFFSLFAGRFVALVALAWLDRGSLGLPAPMREIATLACALPAAYTAYSVARYFGLVRAAGADHFEPRYRQMPLVREGIFRFTRNGMYCYAFLAVWAIAFGFDSAAALVVAAFNHAYIWVHYFATEKPDMRFLYGATP